MAQDQEEESGRPNRKDGSTSRPFPRSTYVYGWLVICLVVAEGINGLVSGRIGTGIILIGLVPLMVWLMHTRRHQARTRKRG